MARQIRKAKHETNHDNERRNIIVNCDEPVNGYQQFVFSPGTIASWTALLGLGSDSRSSRAIMQGVEDTNAIRSVNRQGV